MKTLLYGVARERKTNPTPTLGLGEKATNQPKPFLKMTKNNLHP
jgi:hypothetical protein